MSRVRRDVVVLVASLAVFAGCAVVAADGRVGPIERALFHAVNGLPDWLYQPMLLSQYLGCWPCRWSWPWGAGVPALAAGRRAGAGGALQARPERLVKLLVQRERPGPRSADAVLHGVHRPG